jgi:hypothetical protein
MQRWLVWIGSVITLMYGGPGLVDARNLDLTPPAADDAAARWVTRSAIVAPLVVVVLFLVAVAWPIVVVVAAILLLPLVISRIRVLRGR